MQQVAEHTQRIPSQGSDPTSASAVTFPSTDFSALRSAQIDPQLAREIRAAQPEQAQVILDNLNKILQADPTSVPAELRSLQTRRELVNSIAHDILHPDKINQGMCATCTVTCMQHMIASRDPAEYSRIMADLSTTGSATLRSGETMQMLGSAVTPDKIAVQPPFEERQISERLFQASAMQFAVSRSVPDAYDRGRLVPTGAVYDPSTDTTVGTYQSHSIEFRGAFKDQYEPTLEALLGKGLTRIDVEGAPDQAMSRLEDQLARDGSVLTEIRWGGRGDLHELHAISVTKIEGDTVYFFNPHGAAPPHSSEAIQSMSREEFEGRLSCVLVDGGKLGEVTPPPTFVDFHADGGPSLENSPIRPSSNPALEGVINVHSIPTEKRDDGIKKVEERKEQVADRLHTLPEDPSAHHEAAHAHALKQQPRRPVKNDFASADKRRSPLDDDSQFII